MALQQFGRYEVISELGRGAMGIVYKAVDPVLNRVVAVKTINLLLAGEDRDEYEARFYQEAKAVGGLSHPSIVTIYDLGNTGDTAYMAMELLEGKELRELLEKTQSLSVAQAVSITTQVADGLAYAHDRDIVHRDIKPANIMVLADDVAKITDFGIARIRTSDIKTQTGMRLGSPKYMSPEQTIGERTDHRSDIFSLGIVLYEILTGKPPFSGTNLESLMYQTIHIVQPPPSMTNPDVPQMLDLIVAKMLQKSVEDRYQSAKDIVHDLRECEKNHLQRSEKTGAVSTAILQPDTSTSNNIGVEPVMRTSGVIYTRQNDTEQASDIGVGALEISPAFDSFEATQRLAKETGMAGEFEDFSATMKLAHTTRLHSSTQTSNPPTIQASVANNPDVEGKGWSSRDKLFASVVLLIATLVAIVIVVY